MTEKKASEISFDSTIPLDFLMSQNKSANEIMIAPKKIHFATSGGMDASALILELPMTSNETKQCISILEPCQTCSVAYLLSTNLLHKPKIP